MQTSRINPWVIATLVVGALALVISLPDSAKSWAPSFLRPELKLGLDLAGGTQLDFRISEDELNARKEALRTEIQELESTGSAEQVAEKQAELSSLELQQANIVEAIRTVLERRINSLGVSEAVITPSYYGEEKHLLVDCPGVINPDECSATVGKTIQLEFKEEFTEATEEYKESVRTKAREAFGRIERGEATLAIVGEDLSNDLGIAYEDQKPYFQSELPPGLAQIWNRAVGDPPIMAEGSINAPRQTPEGGYELATIEGIYITEVTGAKQEQQRTLTSPLDALEELAARTPNATFTEQNDVALPSLPDDLEAALTSQAIGTTAVVNGNGSASVVYLRSRVDGEQSMDASHILIAYKGAARAPASVTRDKEEAQATAQQILDEIRGGASFEEKARAESDGGESAAQGGSIGTVSRGVWPAAFDAAAFALKQGEMSNVVETAFGFHIIRADSSPVSQGGTVSYAMTTVRGDDAAATAAGFKTQIEQGSVTKTDEQITVRSLFFSLEPTGWRDTELTGEYFRFASVTTDGITNIPVVQIQFDSEGGRLFQELTKRNIGKSIAIFVGGELVSAPTVQQEISGGSAVITGVGTFDQAQLLATDLNTGAIPAPIHLSGQYTIEATLGQDALASSLRAALVGFVILSVFMIFMYRLLGVIAVAALAFYVVLFAALLKLPLLLVTDQNVVLTLAGIAGMILSIGLAVDANVLIFERMKEEMRKGKNLQTAADTGFKRAWPSIRDGNATTLITCAILFIIGTSIVRGFAITLSIGIVLSLFTAIVVTRWMIDQLIKSPLAERSELFGVKEGRVRE